MCQGRNLEVLCPRPFGAGRGLDHLIQRRSIGLECGGGQSMLGGGAPLKKFTVRAHVDGTLPDVAMRQ